MAVLFLAGIARFSWRSDYCSISRRSPDVSYPRVQAGGDFARALPCEPYLSVGGKLPSRLCSPRLTGGLSPVGPAPRRAGDQPQAFLQRRKSPRDARSFSTALRLRLPDLNTTWFAGRLLGNAIGAAAGLLSIRSSLQRGSRSNVMFGLTGLRREAGVLRSPASIHARGSGPTERLRSGSKY